MGDTESYAHLPTLSGSKASTKLRTKFNNYPLLKSDGTDVTIHNNGHTIQVGAAHIVKPLWPTNCQLFVNHLSASCQLLVN